MAGFKADTERKATQLDGALGFGSGDPSEGLVSVHAGLSYGTDGRIQKPRDRAGSNVSADDVLNAMESGLPSSVSTAIPKPQTFVERCWPIQSRGLNIGLLTTLLLGGAVTGLSFGLGLSDRLASEITTRYVVWPALIGVQSLATLFQGIAAANASGLTSAVSVISIPAPRALVNPLVRCGQRIYRAESDQKLTAIAWAIELVGQAILWSGVLPKDHPDHEQAKWTSIITLGAACLMLGSLMAWASNRYYPKGFCGQKAPTLAFSSLPQAIGVRSASGVSDSGQTTGSVGYGALEGEGVPGATRLQNFTARTTSSAPAAGVASVFPASTYQSPVPTPPPAPNRNPVQGAVQVQPWGESSPKHKESKRGRPPAPRAAVVQQVLAKGQSKEGTSAPAPGLDADN